MLRLVRLQAEGSTFDPVSTVRAALQDLDDPERVDAVLGALAAAGVVRVAKGESDEMDRVALRSPELMTGWPALKGWLDERLKFRALVAAWDRSGRPASALATGDQLEEARRYHDRNPLERDLVNRSAYQQARQLEQAAIDRRQKWVWRGLALVAVLGWVVAGIGWIRAIQEGKRAAEEQEKRLKQEQAEREAIELDTAASSASTLAIASLLMSEHSDAVHAAKKVLIIQTLRQVLFAPNESAAKAAAANWRRLEAQLKHDPKNPEFFNGFLLETHKAQIEQITSGPPLDKSDIKDLRARIKALQQITLYLNRWINIADTQEALGIIRPVIMQEAIRVAARIKQAAEAGHRLSEVRPYQLAFWRLWSSSLVLITNKDELPENADQDEFPRFAVTFANALRSWEDAGGEVASPRVIESLDQGLKQLQAERDRHNPR
jgi:hypothetical protein